MNGDVRLIGLDQFGNAYIAVNLTYYWLTVKCIFEFISKVETLKTPGMHAWQGSEKRAPKKRYNTC